MLAVIFEVWPAAGRSDAYFDIAASLKSELEKIDGFISVERFESIAERGKFLSLSFWRDEESMRNWYTHSGHAAAQRQGRDGIFRDYRIRVGNIVRDYGLEDGRPGGQH